jgi:nucleoside 2-deoxyribosyltransferase
MIRREYAQLRIYVASSWRNKLLDTVFAALNKMNHVAYDFRHADTTAAFSFKNLGAKDITAPETARALIHAAPARAQLQRDLDAIQSCDVLILLNPCGRSAHFEAGMAVQMGKRVVVLQDKNEPDLLYATADRVVTSLNEMLNALDEIAWEQGTSEAGPAIGFRKD